jgi:branched-chain amino acid transport system substrate-binding protein
MRRLAATISLLGALAFAQEPIKIGAVFNATGWMAAYDQPPQQGAALAIEEINAAGGVLGRPLELTVLDGETDPATVFNAALQLINDGADFIIAPSDFDIGGPASTAAQEAGLVGVSPGASSPLYGSGALGDKQFTVAAWTNYGSATAAEWAYNDKGWQDAYVIKDTSIDYSDSQGNYFISSWEELGGNVVGRDSFVQGEAEFSALLQRLQSGARNADVIFIASYMPDLGTLVRDIRALGIETPILGGDAYDTTDFYEVLGERFGNDIFFATHSYVGVDSPDSAMRDFVTAYEAKYRRTPDNSFIVLGYDAVKILAMAVEEAGTTEGGAVADAMEEMTFDLLSGQLDWSDAASGHETDKEVFILGVQGGIPAYVTQLRPASVPTP